MVGCKNLIDWDFLKIITHFPLGAMPLFWRGIHSSFIWRRQRAFRFGENNALS
jgi:hypothetical protein